MRPYYEDEAVQIFHGNAEDVLRSDLFTEKCIDAVITDPPYSEHVHEKSRKGLTAHAGKFSERKELGFPPMTDGLRFDVSGLFGWLCNGWVLVFTDCESAHLWRESLQHGNRLEYLRTGVWVKVGGTPQFTGDRPAVGFEEIVMAHPPGRKDWNGGGKQAVYRDVWEIPIVVSRGGPNEVRMHETQKPARLISSLIADFTEVGDVVLDSFMGSGTALAEAKRLGRKAIGIDCREWCCEVAATRLSQGALDLFQADSA